MFHKQIHTTTTTTVAIHQHGKQCFFKHTLKVVVLIWFRNISTEKPTKREIERARASVRENAEVEFDAHATMWFALQTLHIYSNHANPVKCFNTFRISFAFGESFPLRTCWCAECGWTSMIKFTSTNDINSCRKSFYAALQATEQQQLGFGARPSTYRHVKHCNLWPSMQIISANHLINFSLLCVCW